MNEWNQEKLAHDRISEATVHGKGSNLRSQRIASTELMLFVSPVPPQSPWLSLVTSTLPTMPAWAEWCSFLASNCSWVSAHTGCKTTNLLLLFPQFQEGKMDNVSLVGGKQNFVLGDTVHYLCFLSPQMSRSICSRIHPPTITIFSLAVVTRLGTFGLFGFPSSPSLCYRGRFPASVRELGIDTGTVWMRVSLTSGSIRLYLNMWCKAAQVYKGDLCVSAPVTIKSENGCLLALICVLPKILPYGVLWFFSFNYT